MCGIAGLIQPEGVTEEAVTRMIDAIAHRGPDDSGVWLGDGVGLGHRRLSIIDLEGSRQPMSNEDESVWITFNGEIYNYEELRPELAGRYSFRTAGDTEVLLHLYEEEGEKLLSRLRGMFAFGIYDRREKKLLLARDHFGQKPLYYWHDGNRFAFASEIKALLALDPGLAELDENALYEYLTLRIIAPPRSMFRRIRKLPPGHYLEFQNGKIRVEPYWRLSFEPKLTGGFDDLLGRLDDEVQAAVKYHLVSDVPVGAFLSGGIDSSLIVSMMSGMRDEPIKAFSGDVPYGEYSEYPYAARMAKRCGAEIFRQEIKPTLVRTLPEIVRHMDEPSDPLSLCLYHIAELARSEVKVVLGGDGGDELFGGYDRYFGNLYVGYYAAIPRFLRRGLLGPLLGAQSDGGWYRSRAHKLKWMHSLSFYEGAERYAKSLGYFYFSDSYRNDLLTGRFRRAVRDFDPEVAVKEQFDGANAKEPIDRMLHSDSMVRMPDHPVMILDRMSMAHGLEARSPFLDHKLAEFCAGLPPSFKVRGKKLRHIEKKLAERYVPAEVLNRGKQGFSSPLTYLLADEFRFLYRALLTDSSLVREGILRPEGIRSLLEDHLSGRRDHGQRLWLLCNAEIWYRMFIEGKSTDEMHEAFEKAAG